MDGVKLPQMLLYLTSDAIQTSYNSTLVHETEEFDSIVSIGQRLNEQVAHAADERLQTELQTLVALVMEEERKGKREELESSVVQETSQGTSQNGPERSEPPQSFSSLLPKALSAVLHPKLHPSLNSDSQTSTEPNKHTPANLEQLQTELRDLRGQFDQMKSQHNKEIKLLMNELDEEKRIRLTLQMEIQRMKKHMSK